MSSIKSKCIIQHISQITNLKEFIEQPDCFFYYQLHDRYINRMYDVVAVKDCLHFDPILLIALKQMVFQI